MVMYCVQVPRLRYQLTGEDYERDRQAQISRVKDMLEELEDEKIKGK